ncbi:MAG: tripartite tricarboxylate transporter permease [Thermoplasmata archaeon]|nr:tripartite tricarboxylate transporter permease [Thermoplasmata archaeon]
MIHYYLVLLLFALLGVVISAVLALIPGLHVYNVIGFAFLAYLAFFPWLDDLMFAMLLVGMLTGFALLFTITTVYLSAPDDSTMFMVMPGQKYLLQGRGHESVLLTGIGSLVGIFFLVVVLTMLQHQIRVIREVTQDHWFWIIGAVIVYILMSEFPKDFGRSKTTLGKLRDAWKTLAAGYLTFLLSSILGMIIFYKTTMPIDRTFQSLMPPLVGMFAVPNLLINIISDMEIPKQHVCKSVDVTPEEVFRGGGSGCLGGIFGAFMPAVTAGVAGLISGHATAQKGDKPFIISMGASRMVYYVGAVMLFFLPGLHLRRGAIGIFINLFFVPETAEQYYLLAAAVAVSGAVAFILLLLISRSIVKILDRVSFQKMSIAVLFVIILIVFAMGGPMAVLTMSVGAAIGTIPIVFHSRRSNCLAVILVPIFLNMAGIGPQIAAWMGLM